MDLNHYQSEALKFRLPTASLIYSLLNLSGEVGELHSLLAKSLRDGPKDNHSELLLKELGDILWQLAAVADDHGFDLGTVAEANLYKLQERKAKNTIQGSGDLR